MSRRHRCATAIRRLAAVGARLAAATTAPITTMTTTTGSGSGIGTGTGTIRVQVRTDVTD